MFRIFKKFKDLLDTPVSYSGQSGKVVAVKGTEDGVEFITPSSGTSTFLGLTDTPASYSGQANKVVAVNGSATGLAFATASGGDGGIFVASYLTSSGGGAAPTQTTIRTLNWTLANTILGSTLASNQIYLPPGSYRVQGNFPASVVNGHQAYLWNVSISQAQLFGSSAYSSALFGADYFSTQSIILGRIVLSSSPTTTLEVRHFVQTVNLTGTALGIPSGNPLGQEIQGIIQFIKEA